MNEAPRPSRAWMNSTAESAGHGISSHLDEVCSQTLALQPPVDTALQCTSIDRLTAAAVCTAVCRGQLVSLFDTNEALLSCLAGPVCIEILHSLSQVSKRTNLMTCVHV